MKKFLKKDKIILLVSVFIILFLVHFPLFYKDIITADVLLNNYFYNGYSWEISLGRFGLYFIGILKNFMSFPHIDLIFSFLLISSSVILLIDLFNVKNLITKIFIILLFSLSPIISATLLFHYCSIAYFLALFASTLSIYLFYKCKNKYIKFIIPCILIVISLSMYQAYFSYIVTLFMIYNLYLLINNKINYKESFKYLIVFIIGVLSYFILMKLSLVVFHIDMSSYSNANSIGISTLLNIPSKIIDSYILFYNFFFTNEFMKNSYLFNNIVNLLILIMFIISFMMIIIKNKSLKNIIISFIVILLLPVFLNSVIFVISDSKLQLLMSASYLILFFFIISINENKYIKYFTYILLVLLFRNYLVQDQATYMSLSNTFNRYDTIITSAINNNINDLDKNFVIIGNIELNRDNALSKVYDYNYGYISDDGIFWDEYNLRKIAFERFCYEYHGIDIKFADEDVYNYILNNRDTDNIIYEIDNTIVIDLYNY